MMQAHRKQFYSGTATAEGSVYLCLSIHAKCGKIFYLHFSVVWIGSCSTFVLCPELLTGIRWGWGHNRKVNKLTKWSHVSFSTQLLLAEIHVDDRSIHCYALRLMLTLYYNNYIAPFFSKEEKITKQQQQKAMTKTVLAKTGLAGLLAMAMWQWSWLN